MVTIVYVSYHELVNHEMYVSPLFNNQHDLWQSSWIGKPLWYFCTI